MIWAILQQYSGQWLEYNHCNVSIDHNLRNFCLNCKSVVQTTWTKIVLKIASHGLKISPKCVCAHWESLQHSPNPLAGLNGGRKGGERRERGRGRGGEGEGDWPPSSFMLIPTLRLLLVQKIRTCLITSLILCATTHCNVQMSVSIIMSVELSWRQQNYKYQHWRWK